MTKCRMIGCGVHTKPNTMSNIAFTILTSFVLEGSKSIYSQTHTSQRSNMTYCFLLQQIGLIRFTDRKSSIYNLIFFESVKGRTYIDYFFDRSIQKFLLFLTKKYIELLVVIFMHILHEIQVRYPIINTGKDCHLKSC